MPGLGPRSKVWLYVFWFLPKTCCTFRAKRGRDGNKQPAGFACGCQYLPAEQPTCKTRVWGHSTGTAGCKMMVECALFGIFS
ncbi:hypothetical protein CH063_15239 [Colletotrichum higginsianum]|uniref:Secreted protein n=1 Tax=Colletotrichum higginsianum (strain IMI 349063) TaxID=759273 RepID=H1V6H9_COLHI|nr:hypothetical protein CH063_01381 [Colletotrichum higginsianum]CCF46508.1 hypothetical protein CH063_15239 [Colletotrichum higginsianum]